MRRSTMGALVVIGLAVAVRTIQIAADSNLWFDELALALNVQERGFVGLATEPLDRLQVAPLGFLLALEAITRAFGLGELAFRALPYASALASIVLFWRVALRFVQGPGLLCGLLLLAVSPSLVYLAGTAKPYAGDVAVTLLLVWLGLRFFDRVPSVGRALAAGALGALGIVLSNPAVPTAALVGALMVARVVRTGPRASLAPLAALLVPWALAALVSAVSAVRLLDPATEAYMDEFWRAGFPPSGLAAVPWLARQLYGVVAHLLIFIVPSGGPLVALVIVPVLPALWGAPFLWRRDRWAAGLMFAPLVIAIVCAAAELLPLRTRVGLYAAWPILLCAMAGIERAGRAWRPAVPVLASACAGVPAAAVLLVSPPPYRAEPIVPVLEEIVARRQPGDPLYVHYGAEHALDFYGPRVGVGAWTLGGMHRDDPRAYLRELDAFRGRPRVWIAFTHALPRYGELDVWRAYLETIGTITAQIEDPFDLPEDLAAGAWLVDLSDPERLRTTTADTFALPTEEPMTRSW